MSEVNTCPRCHAEEQDGVFYRDRTRKSGFSVYCKACMRVFDSERRASRIFRWGEWDGRCTKCGEQKPETDFPRRGRVCTECRVQAHRIWVSEHGDPYKEKRRHDEREYRKANPDVVRLTAKKSREKNIDKVHERGRTWRNNNRDALRIQYRNTHQREKALRKIREQEEPWRKLNRKMSSEIRRSIGANKNGHHWEDLVGYSMDQLKAHLESLFTIGMSWETWGKFGWHIDHIRPRSSFFFDSYEDKAFKQCWSLSNLQPLWWKDNLEKASKVA